MINVFNASVNGWYPDAGPPSRKNPLAAGKFFRPEGYAPRNSCPETDEWTAQVQILLPHRFGEPKAREKPTALREQEAGIGAETQFESALCGAAVHLSANAAILPACNHSRPQSVQLCSETDTKLAGLCNQYLPLFSIR
jgi:hypothetical protein